MKRQTARNFIRCAIGLAAFAVSLVVRCTNICTASEEVTESVTPLASGNVTESAAPSASQDTVEVLREAIALTISYQRAQLAATDEEEYLAALSLQAGNSLADWSFLNLLKAQSLGFIGPVDCSAYETALLAKIAEEDNTTGTDREREALCFAGMGVQKDWIRSVLDHDVYSKGIMSEIYGLRLAATGDYGSVHTEEELAEAILSRRLDNGAYGLTEDFADTDVTAMALQSLAKYSADYGKELEDSLVYLAGVQSEEGYFASMGENNAESTAQVILALTALQIDPLEDTRFNAKSQNLLAALLSFSCGDGSFAHTLGGESNSLSTVQALSALLSLAEFYEIEGSYAASYEGVKEDTALNGFQVRMILLAVLVGILFLAISYLVLSGRKTLPAYIAFVGVSIVLAVFLLLARIETPEEYRTRKLSSSGSITTFFSLSGVDYEVEERTIVMEENATAFDQLLYYAIEEDIAIGYTGSELFGNVYVQSVNGLAEYDHGNDSGWTYTVNGEYPQVSAAAYVLKEGDVVRWIYVWEESR